MRIDIGIATSDRREVLRETIAHLSTLHPLPYRIIVCPAKPEHIDRQAALASNNVVLIIEGPQGLPAQRNAILDASDADVMVFLDDDFLPAPNFIEEVDKIFTAHPDVVVATGHVIADGIIGPGLDNDAGLLLLNADKGASNPSLEPVFNAYGCNMILRAKPIRQNSLRFDETLPLYGWLEDVDFSRQLAPYGKIVRANSLRGVHLGTKRSGRTPGRKLGYSQIANRVYLARKGNLPWLQAVGGMARNIGANLLHWHAPEPWVDRRGRLAGNALAIADWLSGTVQPGKILTLK
ncbi:Glycosyltransferase, GT2 family [Rhizobium sp. NFR07]|uniref:glycosyltransferase family 2 protein n=1 Tax=Rhizobium sp. NFR07 TaxID=1566262 RepID=UPI0008EEF623|nr:glycosyltransferase family 2 protein [Rhizobium sp. NFR07]SFB62929.1 Glycosyltransferase, GT2 family [Rhizobium sp. NFR07]